MSTASPPPPPEFLDSGGGGPLPPEPGRGGGAGRKALLVGGGVVGLAALGVGAWAAYGFLSTGPQPAEALPAETLGYVSIDLDPSGGQKIEALRTLNKFPAFEDEVGIDTDDDVRKAIFDRIQDGAGCAGLDYGADVEPWLGDRAAVAAVDLGGDEPTAVVVLQVKDADKADAGLDKIKACASAGVLDSTGGEEGAGASSGEGNGGWAIDGDWAVIAESDDVADDVVEATAKGSLADDDAFQKWTDEAGDPGVVTLYAGPAAGDYLADHAEEMFGFPLGLIGGTGAVTECFASSPDGETDPSESCVVEEAPDSGMCSNGAMYDDSGDSPDGVTDPTTLPPCEGAISEEFKQKLRDFDGAAVTVRFDDGAIEVEAAGDSGGMPGVLTAGGTADVVRSLPADTGAVLGVGFADGWFGDLVDFVAPYTGQDADGLMAELSDSTGLDVPEDIETLVGDSAALALGSDFDPNAFFESSDGSDVPVAVKIKGDPDEIEKVLDKLRDMAGPQANVLESDAEGATIVIGPNADYRSSVLEDGDLGENDVFQDAVREPERAQTVLFVNVDEFQAAIEDAAGESDDDFVKNLEPVAGFGVSAWLDDGVAHAVIRLTTD